jgi:hypothetical protein
MTADLRRSVLPAPKWLLLGCCTVIAAVAIPMTLAMAAPTTQSRPKATTYLAAEIDQYAVDYAASDGDATPSNVTWVASNRKVANGALFNDNNMPDSMAVVPVYVLEITGNFVETYARVPPGATAPIGTVLKLIVLQSSFLTVDRGLSDTDPSLASLGTPEVDSLSGIAPMSDQAWSAKFKVAATPGRR